MSGPSASPEMSRLLTLTRGLAQQALTFGNPSEFWPVMARELREAFSCERATLFQAGRGRLVSCHAEGLVEPLVLAAGEGIAGRAAAARQTCCCNDPYADPAFNAAFDRLSGFKTGNLLAVPLIAQDKVVGVVELLNKAGGFTPEDIGAMEFLGSQIAIYFVLFDSEERQNRLSLQMLQMEKMAALGRLVAGFTHEVRNPLFIIGGFAAKLEESLTGPPEALEDLARIRASVKRIEAMVKNLLSFSRASRDTIAPIELEALLDTTLELVRLDAKWRTLEIVRDFEKDAPAIAGNVNTVMQVFLNLIINAFQAMETRGRGRLTLRLRSGPGRREVVVQVEDDGPGIPAAARERVFEPFFTTKGKQGTGLGLPIVAEIVEKHRGRIDVDCPPAGGTVFTVRFPSAGAAPSP